MVPRLSTSKRKSIAAKRKRNNDGTFGVESSKQHLARMQTPAGSASMLESINHGKGYLFNQIVPVKFNKKTGTYSPKLGWRDTNYKPRGAKYKAKGLFG